MCYSAEASISSWIVNIVTCGVLYYLGKQSPAHAQYRVLALFFLAVGTMQLYDYIFYTYPARSRINYVATKAGMITTHALPVLLAALVVFVMKKQLTRGSQILLVVYTLIAVLYSLEAWDNIDYTETRGEHIVWEWTSQPYGEVFAVMYVFTLLFLLRANFTRPVGNLGAGMAITSFIVAYALYQRHMSTGRFWCYFAVFMPLLYIPFAAQANQ